MNCWEILGIDPTRDREAIDRAFEQQKKFATGEEMDRLYQAYREARGEQTERPQKEEETETPAEAQQEQAPPTEQVTEAELTAEEQQVVREVVLQIKALLNDSRRAADDGIWRAILTESPADQPHMRAAVADALEPQVRPMADNGSLSPQVVAFLGDWFRWQELQDGGQQARAAESDETARELSANAAEEGTQSPDTSFWPAVVGWVVALAVLATVFESIFGG